MKKFYQITGLLTTLSLILVACGNGDSGEQSSQSTAQSANDQEEVVNWVVGTELSSLDTSVLNQIDTSNVASHLQEGLYWEDENNEVHPALAEDLPQISDDQLTYTIKVKKGAQWSNGDPITAHDFVYGIQRLVDPETGSGHAYLARAIENVPEIQAGEKSPEEVGFKALDDYTIEVHLTQPMPHLLNMLGYTPFYPLNKDFVEKQGEAFGTNSDTVISSGPYVIQDWDGTNQEWTLVKNDKYFNADKIDIEKIHTQVIKEVGTGVNLFEAGEVDNAPISGELAQQYIDHPEAKSTPRGAVYFLNFNHKNDVLQNHDLRLAIDYAIDNQAVVDQIIANGSQATASLVPKDIANNPKTGQEFVEESDLDPRVGTDQAQSHWKKAQAELGDEVNLTLLVGDSEGTKRLAEYIQGQLQNNLPGLKVNINVQPGKSALEAKSKGNYDLALSGWVPGYASPSNLLELLQSDSDNNDSYYSNNEYDELVNKAINSIDDQERYDYELQANQLAYEDVAILPLYQSSDLELFNSRIKDLTERPVGNEYDFRTAHID